MISLTDHDYCSGSSYLKKMNKMQDMLVNINMKYCKILYYLFVYFGFVLSMFTSTFKAELCTGPGQSQNRKNCEGGKHQPDEGGLLDLGPSALHGKQCKRFTDLSSVVSILKGQMKKLHLLYVFFFQIGNSCFQLIKKAVQSHVRL